MSTATKTKSKKSTKTTKKAAPTPADPDLVPLNEAMKPATTTKKKAAKAPKEKKPKKMSCLDAAAQVLKDAAAPMNCKAMIDAMSAKKLWTSEAPTPAATLYSAILREIAHKKGEARFKKTDRGQFTLNA